MQDTHTHTHSQVHETHKYTYTKLSICAGNLRCCTKIKNVRRRSVIGWKHSLGDLSLTLNPFSTRWYHTYVGAERMSKELLLNSYKFSCCVISYFSLWHLSWNNWQILKELHRSACWNAPWNSAGGPSDQGRTSLRSDYKVSWCFHTNTKCADICILLQCNVSLRMWSIAA